METINFTHNIYLVTMTYDVAQGGTIRMAAESAEKAAELLKKQFASYKNLEVVQVVDESNIKPTSFSEKVEAAPVIELGDHGNDDDETPPSKRLH